MIERFSQGKVSYINVHNPTTEEAQSLMVEFNVPPALMNDTLTPVPQNYVTMIDGVIKMVIDFPVVKHIDAAHPYEVKFIITKKAFITIAYEEMEALDRFKKQFEVAAVTHKNGKSLSSAHLFFVLMQEFYQTAASKLDYINSILADIEAEIFNDNEKQMIVDIGKTGKKLIAFRHVLSTHEDVLLTLRPLVETLYKNGTHNELSEIIHLYYLILNRTSASFETLSALRDTNMAMLTAKQNEIMKVLTIMAFITFPLTLFSSLFGMNTTATPIIGHPYDFWIIVSVMAFVTAFFFTIFKIKKWI